MNLIHGKVYKYHDKNQNDCIAIYLCDTNVSSNVCIIPLKDNDGSENAVQITNLKKGKSYNSSQTVNINISSNNIVLLNGTIDVSSTTTNDTTINEDLSSSVLASSLDATQSEILSQKLLTTITQLTS